MKIIITVLAILASAFFTNGNAQVSIGRSKIGPFKDFKKGEYNLIKSKTSIFVNDDFTIEEMEKIVKQVWTINPYKVISREEFNKNTSAYVTESNAIWQMRGYVRKTTNTGSGFSTEFLHVFYEYFYPSGIKVKKEKLVWDQTEIAAIFMGGNTEAMWEMIDSSKLGNLQEDLYNYKLGYVKNYLQYVNDNLRDEGYSFAYDTGYDKAKLKDLATKTLYVPEYLKTKSIGGHRDEVREDPTELFKKYPYKYEFISDEELNKKIVDGGNEDFYYIMYTRVNGQKMISVTNGKNGDMIYKDYQTISYMMKPKDLGELAHAVKKSSKK